MTDNISDIGDHQEPVFKPGTGPTPPAPPALPNPPKKITPKDIVPQKTPPSTPK